MCTAKVIMATVLATEVIGESPKETMYYWGVNSKMQTSHTLCSRPKRYGALHCGTLATTVP